MKRVSNKRRSAGGKHGLEKKEGRAIFINPGFMPSGSIDISTVKTLRETFVVYR
jgi:hypothetical protein